LVQQALHKQASIGWDKAFRGYLSLMWDLLEAPHEVPTPYNKTPEPSTFSKAVWKDGCMKLHDPKNNTSSPTSDLDADIANCYANPQDLLTVDRQLLNRLVD
jgi:hypothetical protein